MLNALSIYYGRIYVNYLTYQAVNYCNLGLHIVIHLLYTANYEQERSIDCGAIGGAALYANSSKKYKKSTEHNFYDSENIRLRLP